VQNLALDATTVTAIRCIHKGQNMIKIGERIGYLTTLSCSSVRINGYSFKLWLCKCDCGNTREVRSGGLRQVRRTPISCGCKQHVKYNANTPRGQKTEDPTPEEIAIECELIRAEWSPEERERRYARQPVSWSVPVVRKSDMRN